MVEQFVEMYEIGSERVQVKAKDEMNKYISNGWRIKHMAMTPGYDGYSSVYPKLYVVYEREVKVVSGEANNIS